MVSHHRRMKQQTNISRLGLDFGKVIMGAVQNGVADTSFLGASFSDAMKSPPTEGAFESIASLAKCFRSEVWIVSKCGPSVEKKTRAWLDHNRFYERTGVLKANIRFCRERSAKAAICEELGISHFVDDRIDVLLPMVGVVSNLYLFGEQPSSAHRRTSITPVRNWGETVTQIVHSMKRA